MASVIDIAVLGHTYTIFDVDASYLVNDRVLGTNLDSMLPIREGVETISRLVISRKF